MTVARLVPHPWDAFGPPAPLPLADIDPEVQAKIDRLREEAVRVRGLGDEKQRESEELATEARELEKAADELYFEADELEAEAEELETG